MRKAFVVPILLTVMLLGSAAQGVVSGHRHHAALTETVFAAERAFAKTMAERDFAAFQRYVAEDTVFFNGPQPLVGRAAVLAAWKAYFEAGPAPFAWSPDQVVVLQSGDLALSTGTVTDPSGKTIARFNSIWRRQRDGRWQVVFDRGSPICAPEKAAQPSS